MLLQDIYNNRDESKPFRFDHLSEQQQLSILDALGIESPLAYEINQIDSLLEAVEKRNENGNR